MVFGLLSTKQMVFSRFEVVTAEQLVNISARKESNNDDECVAAACNLFLHFDEQFYSHSLFNILMQSLYTLVKHHNLH